MCSTIQHRGPDDCGTYIAEQDGIALGHRRLSILDLSDTGHQPMVDMATKTVIIYNGELYNFRELRSQLEQRGYSFQGHSDTEVLLKLYLEYGTDLMRKLNGIFSFAIWDNAKKELFLARDPFGVKPLYYAESANSFLFASELKTLLSAPEINREIDPQALWNYIHYLWSPAPITMLRGIKKFVPGEAIIVAEGQVIKKWSYYEGPLSGETDDIITLSRHEQVLRVRSSVRRAVQRQMVADVPVGAFLSGGLDSSSVVAFAREFSSDRLQCFTIDLKGQTAGFADDLPFAQRVARYLDVDLNIISVGAEITERLEDMIYYLDEPQADPAPLNALLIAELARKHGIKVLLSGAGGDDIFTGYRRHYALMQERYWRWLPVSLCRMLRMSTRLLPSGIPICRRMAKAFANADSSQTKRLAGYFHWLSPEIGTELLHGDYKKQLVLDDEPILQSLRNISVETTLLQKMLWLELRHFLCDHNLNYTDKMAMAAGVEVRVPFLDPELVQLAFSLPDNLKQRGSTGKWILKKAMEGILPNNVIYRPKTGFGAPLRRWLHNEWRDLLEDTLSVQSIKERGIFNADTVRALIECDRSGYIDASYPLFALICMELWCRRFHI